MARFELEVQVDEQVAGQLPQDVATTIEAAVQAVLGQEEMDTPTNLTVLLTDDNQLHQLNREFLGIDRPTDVLSFPDGEVLPDTNAIYLGDIAVSVDTAQRQATTAGHALSAELQLLTIHGVLHLLGHDHADSEEKEVMWAAQADALAELGLTISPSEYPDEESNSP